MFHAVFVAALALTFGDPSRSASRPASDSIYALAVDPSRYAVEQFIYLLDDGVIRLEPDGRASRTYRQVIQILKEDAVERWAEHSFSFDPDRERLIVNWARVVKPSGEVLSPKPEVSQESDVPASMADPVYVRRKVRRISLAKVAPGTLVDVSYTIEELKPYRAGDFHTGWRVNPGLPVRRSRLLLDLPAGFEPRLKERNLDFSRKVENAGGRRRIVWATQDVPKWDAEPFAADSNGVVETIDIAAPSSWKDIGAWYAGLARDRYQVTPAVARKVTELVAGARTLEDSLRALHRFVAHDVRYVAVSLGIGGYQPRPATQVLETGFGDCKDKATLFVAMLAQVGVTAYPVLLHSQAPVDRELPTISAFDHAIAVVERAPAGGRVFADLTASYEPWGSLPSNLYGQFALVVHPDGRTEEVTLSEPDRSTAKTRLTFRAELDTAGYVSGTLEMQMGGPSASMFRALFGSGPDSTARAGFAHSLVSGLYPEVEGDSLEILDQGDAGADPRFRVRVRNGRAAQRAGNAALLDLPFKQGTANLSPVIAQLERHRPRKFPIDVAEVSAVVGSEAVFEITLPEGWRAEVPAPIQLSSPFGELSSRYVQEGRLLRVERRQAGRQGVLPPERVDELIAWLKQLTAAERTGGSIALIR